MMSGKMISIVDGMVEQHDTWRSSPRTIVRTMTEQAYQDRAGDGLHDDVLVVDP